MPPKKESSQASRAHSLLLFFLFNWPVFLGLSGCFLKSNKEPLPLMVSRCHKSDAMTNWLFCLLFLFLCLMSFRQSFDPANLMDPHRKHLPPEDVFITRRLDARHLHGSTATDKLSLLPARAKRTAESLNKMLLNFFLTVWFCTLVGGYPFL